METKSDLFFTLHGLDAHVELVAGEGEDMLTILESTVQRLIQMGAQARPQPTSRGGNWSGGKGQGQAKNFVQGEKCPNCGSDIVEKTGTSKQTGKPWRLWLCEKGDSCFKQFKDVNPTPAPAPNTTAAKQTPLRPAPPVNEPVKFQPKATEWQLKQIREVAAKKMIPYKWVEKRCSELYGVGISSLNKLQAAELLTRLAEAKVQQRPA